MQRVAFFDGQVMMWPKGKTIDDATMTGEEDDGLYKLKGQSGQALVHESIEPIELRHRRIAHVHYRALSMESKTVFGLPEIQENHEGILKGCAQGKNENKTFPNNKSNPKGILEIVHSDVCGPMS